jgi:RNA polymerase sigma-70 factor, ECF subfamily
LEKLLHDQRLLVLTAYTKGTRMDDLAAQRGETPMALYKKRHRIRQELLGVRSKDPGFGGTAMNTH